MHITENWSRIRGRIEAWTPPKAPGEAGTLTIAVERVDDVESAEGTRHRNLLAHAAGTRLDVIVPAAAAGRMAPRKGATAVVEVRRGRSPTRVFAHPERITVTHE